MLQVLNSYTMTKDIAIIGGTFNPVHVGHIEMVKYLLDNTDINEVWIMPSYNSPHKDIDTIYSFETRIEMLKLSFSDFDKVIISRYEEEYAKKHPNTKSYTYEILEDLKKMFDTYKFNFVVGFDSIKEINTWHRYLELIRDYEFYIFDRNDSEFKTLEQKKFYLDNLGKHQCVDFKYKFFDYKVPNISSTSIRKMLQNKNEYINILNIFLNKKVLQYIINNNLYI